MRVQSENEAMTAVQEKQTRLVAITENARQFTESGGVIGSGESGPHIILLFRVIDDMAPVTDPRRTVGKETDICVQS